MLILVTGLSIFRSSHWWVRIWDFPRPQILFALVLVAGLVLWADPSAGKWIAATCFVAAAWQLYRIYPYTSLARHELAFADDAATSDERCFSVLTLNVLQSNHDFQRTARLIDRIRPDILLLLETNQRWADALSLQLGRFPRVHAKPLDNTYGMIFATRLPMRDARFEAILEEGTPSFSAELTAGDPFRVIALHPRPPRPGQDTGMRDAEIMIAARRAAVAKLPVLAIGDFNDVAWSRTSRLFKHVGGFLDPRIGRGTFATFPAQVPLLGWPLDHLFVTPQFAVRSLAVLEKVGSDHLPIHAELCLTERVPAGPKPERSA